MSEIKLSIIIPVLNSHEAVRRQIRYLSRLILPYSEVVIVDDGSDPPLHTYSNGFNLRIIPTNDFRPWTQPQARNIGAEVARAAMLVFFDVDHIVSARLLNELDAFAAFAGDRIDWRRIPASISKDGELEPAPGEERKPAAGIFAMRAEIYRKLGGFDERFCGEYGFDDLDFLERYNKLVEAGEAKPNVTAKAPGYYWTGEDAPKFHDLSHEPSTRNVQILSEKDNA